MRCLRSGYVYDESQRQVLNEKGQNYWWTYIGEILDRLGISADVVSPDALPAKLHDLSVLFLGPGEFGHLGRLGEWVSSGGILIACCSEGLDTLFGNANPAWFKQDNPFSVSARLHLEDTPFGAGIRSPLHPGRPLLIASDRRLVESSESIVIAESNGQAAITGRQIGDGWAFYFGFDLAQTFWVIQQGRPVDRDYDGDNCLRTIDAIITGDYDPEIPYTDELLFLLQNMVAQQPYPLIHQLPPKGEIIPDFLIHCGGDDEALSEDQIPAAEFMASRNLPYHINCMAVDGKFGLDREQIDRLNEIGTELSLHYNFMDGFDHPCGFSEADVQRQFEAFVAHFGKVPVCTVAHCARWTGWTEPAVWMSRMGQKADNSYCHVLSKKFNPVNEIGFAFGTSYPFYFYKDCSEGNGRMNFLELPFNAFEVGYEGEQTDFACIDRALSLARHYQSTMNFFYHPIYIARYPACREAIDYLLLAIKRSGDNPVFTTPDQLTHWWNDRSASRISDLTFHGEVLTFSVLTSSPDGIVVKIPLVKHTTADVSLPHRTCQRFGLKWLEIVVPSGSTEVAVTLH